MATKLHPKVLEHLKKIGAQGGKARGKNLSKARKQQIGKDGAAKRWGEKKRAQTNGGLTSATP